MKKITYATLLLSFVTLQSQAQPCPEEDSDKLKALIKKVWDAPGHSMDKKWHDDEWEMVVLAQGAFHPINVNKIVMDHDAYDRCGYKLYDSNGVEIGTFDMDLKEKR